MDNSTIFDDILRTIQERRPKLLIPLVNEVFHTSYGTDTEVTRLPEGYQKLMSKVIADSCNVMADFVYHFECQSKKDGSMILRMVEYDFMIALSDARRSGSATKLKFPRSCIIYLRSAKSMLSEERMEIIFSNSKSITYQVPVIRLRDYSIEEIFEKNLLILLPYYIMNYEKELSKIAKNEESSQALLEEYRRIVKMLEEKTKDDDTGLFYDMMQLMRRLVHYMLRRQVDLRERMCEEMGGKVLRLPSDELREERELGVEIGMKKGISQGLSQGLSQGTALGKVEKTSQVIANMLKRGMSDEDICALVECDAALIEEVRGLLK